MNTWDATEPLAEARQRAARSTGWLVAESVIRMAATALVSFWIARRVGPEGYGVLNFASALAAIAGGLAMLGLELPVVVRLARGEAPSALLSDVLMLRGVAGMVCTLLAAAVAIALLGDDPEALAVSLIALLSVLAGLPMLVDLGFKAQVEAGVPARARVAASTVGALARVAVVATNLGLAALAGVLVAETLIASLLLWRSWARWGGPLPNWRNADGARARRLLREGLPFLGIAAATMVYAKADIILLGHFAEPRQVGLYAATQKLSEVLYIAPAVLVDSVYPMLVRRAEAELPGLSHGQLLFDLASGSAMVTVAVAVLLAPWFIVLVFGERYGAAVPLFQAHALTGLMVALELARSRWLASVGRPALVWLGATLGAGCSLGVNLWAMPRYGASGAVSAALLAFTVMAWLPAWLAPSLRPLAGMQWRSLWPWGRLWTASRGLAR
jgi:O-antigen/teichoic acid export membrane protein